MRVEIWSDVVCPWCAIGKRRFESALGRFEHRDEVEVVWRSFELDPAAPGSIDVSSTRRLADKYGVSLAQARAMEQRVTDAGAAEGLDFRYDLARPGNTLDAHRVLHLAADRGVQPAVKERLLLAYFAEGEPIADRRTLARLAADAGLDADETARMLDSEEYTAAVRADEAEARALGIQGVPFFVLDRRYGVSGAQPADVLLQVLRRAWTEAHPLTVVAGAGAGQTCTDDSCAV
ncbi:MAG: DsbA family oxidoreductase [Mycobacteriales bacterium]